MGLFANLNYTLNSDIQILKAVNSNDLNIEHKVIYKLQQEILIMDRSEFNQIVKLAKSAYDARQKAKEAYENYVKAATEAYIAKAAQEARRAYELSINKDDFELALADKINHDFNTNYELNFSVFDKEINSLKPKEEMAPKELKTEESKTVRIDEIEEDVVDEDEDENEPPSLSDLFAQEEDEQEQDKKE